MEEEKEIKEQKLVLFIQSALQEYQQVVFLIKD